MYCPTKQQIIVLVAYVLNLTLTYLSNTGAYGKTNKEVSDENYVILTPPGWAFAIWGVIFTWEAAACIYLALPMNKENPLLGDKLWLAGWIGVSVSQSLWSITFPHSVVAACILILLIWVFLMLMIQRAWTALHAAWEAKSKTHVQLAVMYLLAEAPFALHCGWITAASTLNVQICSTAYDHTPATVLAVALHSLVFVIAVGWTVAVLYPEAFMGLGICWALAAVSKHEIRPIRTSEGMYAYPQVVYDGLSEASYAAFAILLSLVLVRLVYSLVTFVRGPRSVADGDLHSNLLNGETKAVV